MSKRKIAFLACPVDLENPTPALAWLLQVGEQGPQNGAKYVAVANKFDTPPDIKTFNVQANYPSELPRLVTHANWAKADMAKSPQYRDALALFCLFRFSQAHPTIDQIVLLRGDLFDCDALTALLQTKHEKSFICLAHDEDAAAGENVRPIIFNSTFPVSKAALDIALDITLTGAIYGLDPYCLEELLNQCSFAVASLQGGLLNSEPA